MTDKPVTEMDRWILGALTAVAVALVIGAAISNKPELFLGYLAGPATLGIGYFVFVRD